jgi:glycine/D-amino acid oxidase-like deaminating enzyme
MRNAGSDVIVVGARLIGLATAFELAESGASVTLYDNVERGRAASWAGAGMLAPYTERITNEALLTLCTRSQSTRHSCGASSTRAVSMRVCGSTAFYMRLSGRVSSMRCGSIVVSCKRAAIEKCYEDKKDGATSLNPMRASLMEFIPVEFPTVRR